MPNLIILGTSNAVPDPQHENTHLAVIGEETFLLIDSGNNPTVRLRQAGLDLLGLTDVLLTHFHPDHVSGVPSLLMNSWLLGRKRGLNLYGLEATLGRIEQCMDLYEWKSWPNCFPTCFNNLPSGEKTLAFKTPEFKIFVTPVRHMIPTIGVRIESRSSGKVVVYSSDTEPCGELVRLAEGADILIHESSGAGYGHSSAAQAGETAQQAAVKSLFLIHYPTGGVDPAPLVEEASRTFNGPVVLTHDLMKVGF